MMSTPVKILLIVTPKLVCEGLKYLLSQQQDFIVNGVASREEEALRLVKQSEYDIIIVEFFMPELNGLNLLRQIKMIKPSAKVIILGLHSNRYIAYEAYKMGATGYLSMSEDKSEFMAAVRKVANNEIHVTTEMAQHFVSFLENPSIPPGLPSLTHREYQIFLMMIACKSIMNIAKELQLSVSTVQTFRRRILKKLGIKNTCELVKFAIKEKILELD